jgi:hypothetical protein
VALRPESIETVNIPLDVTEDREFWDVWENGPQFAVLALAGVEPEEIAAFLREQGTTATELIVDLLAGFDVEGALREAGLTAADVAALRRRLLT